MVETNPTKIMDISLRGNESSVNIQLDNMPEEVAFDVASRVNEALRNVTFNSMTPNESLALSIAKIHPHAKLAAVKLLKEESGLGLKESKELMDSAYLHPSLKRN